MIKILLHSQVFDDIKISQRKWYKGLGTEMPRICRLLIQEGKLPGEKAVHYIKLTSLHNKTFHAGINLPKEHTGKRKGARIIYVKENFDLIKIIYVGGHKDKRYDDGFLQVELIEERYKSESFIEFSESLDFNNIE